MCIDQLPHNVQCESHLINLEVCGCQCYHKYIVGSRGRTTALKGNPISINCCYKLERMPRDQLLHSVAEERH